MSVDVNKLIKIIATELSCDIESIKMNSSFVDDLGANSLDIVQMFLVIEFEFDVQFDDEDIKKLQNQTVQDLVEYLEDML